MSSSRRRRVEGERLELVVRQLRSLSLVVQRHLDDVANRGACAELGHPEGFDCGSRSHPGTRVGAPAGRHARGGTGYRHRGDGRDVERWMEVRRARRARRYRRKLERASRRVKRTGRVVAGVALAPVRAVMHPLRTIGLLLALVLLMTVVPGNQLRYLPGTYNAASCTAPAGPLGVRTAAHGAGRGLAWLKRDPFTVEQITAVAVEAWELGKLVLGDLVGGIRGGAAPAGKQLDAATIAASSGAGCATDPGCGGALQASTTSGTVTVTPARATAGDTAAPAATGDALLAQLARRYWTDPDDQLRAVEVMLAESGGNPRAVNPEVTRTGDRAHGLMQTLLPMHAKLYRGDRWDDPDANVRVSHELWLEGGWGPWAASQSRHASFEPRARAILAGAPAPTGTAAAPPAAVPCTTPAGVSTLASAGGPVPAFANGQAPASALAMTSSGVEVRRDVLASWERLAAAYAQRFGRPIVATDGYRSLAGQIAVRGAKPTLAAVPGTSKHGLGIAVDLGGGIERFGTAEHEWMRDNAPRFGWMHPAWARQGGRKPEPWHFEAIVGPAAVVQGATWAA